MQIKLQVEYNQTKVNNYLSKQLKQFVIIPKFSES
jgi:hypothetical protein